ncbi:MAG: ribosome biogenesis GTPase Der [Dehalococcoidia bacterium]
MSASSASLPRVVIVGRPNVGKSSLFNRVVGHRQAIVEDEPGTTRDRLEADVEWLDVRFRLVDTGGFETVTENVFGPLILDQIRTAMRTSAVVVLMVDARDGLTASDFDIADEVRRCGKPVILVANKADNDARELQALAETTGLGFGEPLPISALHNVNVGVLLDDVIALLPAAPPPMEEDRIRVAIIGRPNAGKSMLVNALAGEERMIVSDVAGTTRDAIDTELDTPQGSFLLIDTAGIRRPGKLGTGVERHSVMRASTAVERCDVAILVVDGTEGITAQDTHIAGFAMDSSKALIIAVNKTDLWDDPEEQREWAERQLQGRAKFVPWAMYGFISALERKGLDQLLELVATAREARRRRLGTPELNAVLTKALRDHVPPVVHSRRFKLFYATQADVDPPVFVLFVNDPELLHFSYRRYLERAIREAADFEGTAIKLIFRGRDEEEKRK